jgi:hypothetical protein
MKHPLNFVSESVRKPLFIALLIWTLGLFIVFWFLDRPLSPNGIVSFELARTPERVSAIMAGWTPLAKLYAALGLGLDYLFMPSYALTIALGVLLALKRHGGWFASLGIWVGWGSLAAALFDAFENIALWETLAHGVNLTWPQVAFWCASFKFGLILIGIGFALLGALLPKSVQDAK